MYIVVKLTCLLIALLFMDLDIAFGRNLSKEVWDDIRLINGTNPWTGRVEVKVNGTWGTVCVDRWSISDGYVVCRQLGYDNVHRIYSQVKFGSGTGPTVHEELGCTGQEQSLSECPGIHDPAHVDCKSLEDAGVSCLRPHTRPINVSVICSETQFKCFNEAKCIPRRWVCDTQSDCSDKSDENSMFCDNNCGIQRTPPTTQRIVGGMNARLGSWPWMTSLKIDFHSGVSSSIFCGGTLIAKHWVLTAAHCFDNYVPTASSLRVVVGGIHANTQDVTGKVLRVRHVIKHEGYSPATYDNDIALVHLANSVDISHPYIKPACIPIPGDKPFDMTSNCYVTGFGDTMVGQRRLETLQEAMVPIINNTICSNWYQQQIKNSTICAGYKFGGIDACKGDSGGPLSCKRGERWYVAGVVSWGEGCARAHHPGIYTNVAYFATWITDVIRRNNVSAADIIG